MNPKVIFVVLEHRFYKYNGDVYTALSFPYSYWSEYLEYFDRVYVVARVKKIEKFEPGLIKVSGCNVSFKEMPYYRGLKNFILIFPYFFLKMLMVIYCNDNFLLRSGNVANVAFLFILILRKKYIREYPGNVKEGIIGFAGESLINRLIANLSDYFSRFQGKYSKANSFVSEYCKTLYESKNPSFVFSSFNSGEIRQKKIGYKNVQESSLRLVSVGRLEREKGHYILLQAMVELKKEGVNSTLVLVGDGSEMHRLKSFSKDQEIDVCFLGAVTDRNLLFNTVVACDVFVIPSLTEGMPRALLEAMAIGMPCIGSRVSGVPEVLEDDSMAMAGDVGSLVCRIHEFCSVSLRGQVGTRNLDFIAQKYSNVALRKKRHQFWGKLYE